MGGGAYLTAGRVWAIDWRVMDYYRYQPRQIRFGPGPMTKAVKYIVIACCSIHILMLVLFKLNPELPFFIYRYLGLTPSLFWRGMLWQVFTYLFLHDLLDIWHLVFNMFIFWMFGVTLERDWGTRYFVKFVAVTGVGAGVVSALLLFGADYPIIGFSGVLFGVYAAYLVMYPDREVIFFVFPMRMRTMVYIIIAFEVFRSLSPTASGSIAYLTHFAGLGIGYVYLRPRFYKKLRERYYRWKLKRLKRRRGFGVVKDDDDGPTLH